VAVVIGHFSRRAMGLAVFKKDPDSRDVHSFLGRTVYQAQAKPRYLICDQGKQFCCQGFQDSRVSSWNSRSSPFSPMRVSYIIYLEDGPGYRVRK